MGFTRCSTLRHFISFLSLAFILVGCGRGHSKHKETLSEWMEGGGGQIRVLSTTAMIADLVEKVGKEHVSSLVLIKGEVDPHSYELVKGDAEKLSIADIVFASGLNLEHGASISYSLIHRDHVVFLGDYFIKNFKSQAIYVHQAIDPHIWMDVSIWREMVDPIVEKLSSFDPAHAEEYKRNGALLKGELSLVDEKITSMIKAIPEDRRFLVTSHDAFNYFVRRYLATEEERENGDWKKRSQAPEGLAPDGQLATRDIEEMIDHLKTYQIEFVFPESNVSLDSLKKIHAVAKAKGQSIYFAKTPLYGDSMAGEGILAESYEEMLLHNAKVISGYLSSHEKTGKDEATSY